MLKIHYNPQCKISWFVSVKNFVKILAPSLIGKYPKWNTLQNWVVLYFVYYVGLVRAVLLTDTFMIAFISFMGFYICDS